MPSLIAEAIAVASVPLMTISRTELTSSGNAVWVTARRVGQKASLVDAIIVLLRREPTLLPLRTTPPGKGRITPFWDAMLSAAFSAALRAASALRARIR